MSDFADVTSENCFYCAKFGLVRARVAIVHDARGCTPCCEDHVAWRKTTSHLIGHGENCPEKLTITVKR